VATSAILRQLKAMGTKDICHLQEFMQLLMKPRNGMSWTREDKAAIRTHLRGLASSLPFLVVFTLPGGSLMLPLLAWHLDRRKKRQFLSISPDSIKTPPTSQVTSAENLPVHQSGEKR
jgi:hypothetical protein